MIKPSIVLFCVSYSKDLLRAVKLAKSIHKHNKDDIPFYISVSGDEVDLFREHLEGLKVTVINEQDIIRANQKIDVNQFYKVRGGLRQQVVKSEFWRLNISENYLVLDSDCIFIRDFYESDYIAEDNTPYSIIHEGRDLLQSAERFGQKKVRRHFMLDREPIQHELSRKGIAYDFGYAPFLWSAKVWESLDKNYLTPNKKNFLDAVELYGSEFTWYGEALVKFRAIQIYPREQLFRCYLYEHQLWADQILGCTESVLAKDYLGVVYQSNWESWGDFGPGNKSQLSLIWRSLKRFFKKIYFKLQILGNLI